MVDNKTLERMEEYFGQTVSANPSNGKEIKRRIGIGLSGFGRHEDITNSNLPV